MKLNLFVLYICIATWIWIIHTHTHRYTHAQVHTQTNHLWQNQWNWICLFCIRIAWEPLLWARWSLRALRLESVYSIHTSKVPRSSRNIQLARDRGLRYMYVCMFIRMYVSGSSMYTPFTQGNAPEAPEIYSRLRSKKRRLEGNASEAPEIYSSLGTAVWVCVYLYVCMFIYMHVCMHVCTYLEAAHIIHTYTHTHTTTPSKQCLIKSHLLQAYTYEYTWHLHAHTCIYMAYTSPYEYMAFHTCIMYMMHACMHVYLPSRHQALLYDFQYVCMYVCCMYVYLPSRHQALLYDFQYVCMYVCCMYVPAEQTPSSLQWFSSSLPKSGVMLRC